MSLTPPISIANGYSLFENILRLANPLKAHFVEYLSYREASALEIALSKGSNIRPIYQKAREVLHQMVERESRLTRLHKCYREKVLPKIFQKYPEWKLVVDKWQNVSLEDTVWILRIYDLIEHIPEWQFNQNSDLIKLNELNLIPFEQSPNLLKDRAKIEKIFSQIYRLSIKDDDSLIIPDSICLFFNLKSLKLENCTLASFPNLSENYRLEVINLWYTTWEKTKPTSQKPPDVSLHTRLKILRLDNCWLNAAPNIRNNPSLTELSLNFNQIRMPPDLSQNPNLTKVDLQGNPLTCMPPIHAQGNPQLIISTNKVSEQVKKEYATYPNKPSSCSIQ